jgi:hypothetical protein
MHELDDFLQEALAKAWQMVVREVAHNRDPMAFSIGGYATFAVKGFFNFRHFCGMASKTCIHSAHAQNRHRFKVIKVGSGSFSGYMTYRDEED